MDTTPHYQYKCSSCGVGLTEELAFRCGSEVLCPHCHAAHSGEAVTSRRWSDAGLPGP